jgi:hypothetical protein
VNSMMDSSVNIQTSSHSVPSTPCWFGEAVVIAQALRHRGVLAKVPQRVRFARRRFGRYEVVDFLAVLFGYAVSGERTLEAFYKSLQPFAPAFMALFGRDRLPARSTLSRFLAALTAEAVEALRALFLEELLGRQPDFEQQPCGLTDRTGNQWKVFDIDSTREAARQRALPQTRHHPDCCVEIRIKQASKTSGDGFRLTTSDETENTAQACKKHQPKSSLSTLVTQDCPQNLTPLQSTLFGWLLSCSQQSAFSLN